MEALKIFLTNLLSHNTLIDLAADFRLVNSNDYLKWYKQKHRAKNNIKKVFMLYLKLLEKK